MSNIHLPDELQIKIIEYLKSEKCRFCYKDLPKINNFNFCNKNCLIKYNIAIQSDITYMRNGLIVLLVLWYPITINPSIIYSKYLWYISFITCLLLSIFIEYYFLRKN